jgi:hypothetical protein
MSIMNKKGEVESNLLVWIGIFIVLLISMGWLFSQLKPTHIYLKQAQSDIEQLQSAFNQACSSYSYRYVFNPLSKTGTIYFNRSVVCLKTVEFDFCRQLLCDTDLEQTQDIAQAIEFTVLVAENKFSFSPVLIDDGVKS